MKPRESRVILGIDPGTRITGFGVICVKGADLEALDYGCIRPPADINLSARYGIIYEGIITLIERYQPADVVVETQFVKRNVQSAIKLGMARGMAILAAQQKGIPLWEYAPAKAKQAVTGSGRAAKEQVQRMVQKLLQLTTKPTPEDAADALALAICHSHGRGGILL